MPENDEADTNQQLVQFMTTEHFVLQTARAATIQEANQRANLFLTAVSSATIALAFVAQVTQMGMPFVLFSMILLPCVYFLGLVTFVRSVQVAIEDMVHARGMARIRHYYIDVVPAMKRFLVHSVHDDDHALESDRGLAASYWQSFMSTAGMVATVDGAIAGVFAGVTTKSVIGQPIGFAVIWGILALSVSVFLMRRYHIRAWKTAEDELTVLFPNSNSNRRKIG